MNRREFARAALGTMGAWATNPGAMWARAPHLPHLRVDGPRLTQWLVALARFGGTEDGGVARVAYGEADLEARGYVTELMRSAGLEVTVDLAGNLVGRRSGSVPDLAPLAFGSHIDSVPGGGRYDGPVGSLAAVEVVQTLEENGHHTRHPLEVVIFQNEEGGLVGSRALSGELSVEELERMTHSGLTMREGIRRIGGDPGRLSSARRRPGHYAAFLELHIEQGRVLEAQGTDIGVVEGIVGINWWNVTIEGVANHAGTTPMDQRRDALLAASRFVEMVNRVVTATPGNQVGTVGKLEVSPGAPNVIPGRVAASLELRDLRTETMQALFAEIEREAHRIGEESGTSFTFTSSFSSSPAPTDPRVQQAVQTAANALGLSTRRIPSGAGHDTQSMARFAPAGMIFIPSVNGISHSPQEFSHPEDIENGANVLLHALLALDDSL
jgi:N-carbamoyl-L-amino-acid hydrolase